jgi:hypothetical protein
MSQFSYFHDSFKAESIKSTGKLNLIKNKLLDLDFVKSINDRKNKPEILNDLIYNKVLFVLAEGYKQSLVFNPQLKRITLYYILNHLIHR